MGEVRKRPERRSGDPHEPDKESGREKQTSKQHDESTGTAASGVISARDSDHDRRQQRKPDANLIKSSDRGPVVMRKAERASEWRSRDEQQCGYQEVPDHQGYRAPTAIDMAPRTHRRRIQYRTRGVIE